MGPKENEFVVATALQEGHPVSLLLLRRWILVLLLVAVTPTALYEALQKTSELIQPQRGILRLSARAEWETRWQAATGIGLVDHALHEWRESARFYELAHRRLQEPRHRGRWWSRSVSGSSSRSAR